MQERTTPHEPDAAPAGRTLDTGGRLTLFSYTVESLAPLYRAVMRLFLEAKGRYRIQLRPEEVAAEIRRSGLELPLPGERAGEREMGSIELPEGSVDRALDQLVDWGNLRRSHDTGRVATLEDFRRRHFVYQLTAAGETAERAVGEVLAALERSGSLQRVMLGTILRNLVEIRGELASDDPRRPRPERLFELLFNVTEQFRTLTENASTFLARLHEAIDQGEVQAEAFLIYKQAVLEYLEQFLGELSEIAPRITREVQGIEAAGSERLVTLAARADAAPTPLGLQDPADGLRRKWRGIAAWFVGGLIGDEVEPATVEHLRAAARGAINRILLVLERLLEKRFRRFSRAADLLRLAGWFDRLGREEPGGEERAHRLFQSLFGLFGARHFSGLDEDPDLVRPGASWWEAPPVPIAPVLRNTGRGNFTGRTAQIVDHSRVKQLLAERHRRDWEAQAAALARFAGRGPLALDGLPPLSPDEFALLLSLLDQLLSMPPAPDGRRAGRSRDGRLRLALGPAAPGALAEIETTAGRLVLPAFTFTVETSGEMAVRLRARGGAA